MSTSPSATGNTNAVSAGRSRRVRPNVENPAKFAGPQPSTKQLGTPVCQRASFLICAHFAKRTNIAHIDSSGPEQAFLAFVHSGVRCARATSYLYSPIQRLRRGHRLIRTFPSVSETAAKWGHQSDARRRLSAIASSRRNQASIFFIEACASRWRSTPYLIHRRYSSVHWTWTMVRYSRAHRHSFTPVTVAAILQSSQRGSLIPAFANQRRGGYWTIPPRFGGVRSRLLRQGARARWVDS